MTEVKLAVLGGSGAGKSALAVRFLTRRFIGEYASNAASAGKLSLTDELHWADGFIIVYDISDRASFAFAKALLYRIRESHIGACKKMVESSVFLVGNKQDLCHMREVGWDEGQKLAMDNKCQFWELSAAEHCQEVMSMFTKVLRNITSNFKVKEKRRPSGSRSMAKLINNVFGKRRKSV